MASVLSCPHNPLLHTHIRAECCNGIPGSCKYFRELTPPNAGRNWGSLPGQHSCLFTDVTLWTELVYGYLASTPTCIQRLHNFPRYLVNITKWSYSHSKKNVTIYQKAKSCVIIFCRYIKAVFFQTLFSKIGSIGI